MRIPLLQKVRRTGPFVILLSILLGPISAVQIAGRTPNLFWCDVLLTVFFFAEILAAEPNQVKPAPWRSTLFLFFSAYLVLASISLVWAEDLLYSVAILKLLIFAFISFFYIQLWPRDLRDRRKFVRGFSIFSGLLALQILWSFYFTAHSIESGQYLGEEIFSTKDFVRTSFGRNNYLASLLIITFPVMVLWIRKDPSILWRCLIGFSIGACCFSLFITQSRGGIVSLVAGTLIFLAFSALQYKGKGLARILASGLISITIIMGLVTAVWFLVPIEVKSDFQRTSEFLFDQWSQGNYASNREEIWLAGLSNISENPFFGIGLGNQTILKDYLGMGETTHNLYLDTLLELGLAGLLTLFCVLVSLGRRIYIGWRSEMDPETKPIRAGVLAALFIGLINAFQEPSFWGTQYSIVFWFLMGIGCLKLGTGKFKEMIHA